MSKIFVEFRIEVLIPVKNGSFIFTNFNVKHLVPIVIIVVQCIQKQNKNA